LDDELDHEMADMRDIFEYGLRFVVDGTEREIIDKILSNIIKQEKDEQAQILKTIQKEAVLMIQEGSNPRMLYVLLNSYTDISIKEDEIKADDI
jgi:flagellar motor component MotA